MDFEKVCTIFTMQEPYYGILLSAMDRFPTDKVQTMGVCRSGNVFRLGYNPNFVADKSLEQMLAYLKHETIHIAFNHFSIFDTEPATENEQTIRNIATDLEVNSYVQFPDSDKDLWYFPKNFGWENCLGTMEYYNRLVQLNEQQEQATQPQMPCNGGSGGVDSQNEENDEDGDSGNSGNSGDSGDLEDGNTTNHGQRLSSQLQEIADKSFDDHSMWPKDMTEDQMQDLKQAIDDLCVMAAEEVEKSCNRIPSEMAKRIKILREMKKPKPVTDWKKHFRRFIGNEFSDQIKKSRKRESMRFSDAAGNRHKRKSYILVAIDTSGSVSMREYLEVMGQLKTMKDITFHVVECDTSIKYEYDFAGKIHTELHGGGGTSFEPPIRMYLENRRKYEGIVYFTDGCCPVPNFTPKEMLWVLTSKGAGARERFKKNGATVVVIPEKK